MSATRSAAPPATAKYRDAHVGGCVQASVERRADGTMILRSTEPLGAYPARMSDRLEHWAREAPQRTFIARRGADGQWQHVSYAQMLERAQRIAQALVRRGRGCAVSRASA